MFAAQNIPAVQNIQMQSKNIPEEICRLIAEYLPCQNLLRRAETIEHILTAPDGLEEGEVNIGIEEGEIDFTVEKQAWATDIRGFAERTILIIHVDRRVVIDDSFRRVPTAELINWETMRQAKWTPHDHDMVLSDYVYSLACGIFDMERPDLSKPVPCERTIQELLSFEIKLDTSTTQAAPKAVVAPKDDQISFEDCPRLPRKLCKIIQNYVSCPKVIEFEKQLTEVLTGKYNHRFGIDEGDVEFDEMFYFTLDRTVLLGRESFRRVRRISLAGLWTYEPEQQNLPKTKDMYIMELALRMYDGWTFLTSM